MLHLVIAIYWYTQNSTVGLCLVCKSRSWALQKRLNRSRCCLGQWLAWALGTMYQTGPQSPGKGWFFGGKWWPIVKY